MAALQPLEALRLHEDDLLELLRPRVLVPALAASLLFAVLSLVGLGKPVLLLLVAAGAVLAFVSPAHAFALCVFLFAFRNNAYGLGSQKVADPLFAVTAAGFVIHALLGRRLRLHASLSVVGAYLVTGLLSGLAAQWATYYVLDVIRWLYLILIYLLALQSLGTRPLLLLSVKAFCAAALVMAVCAAVGFVHKYLLHGDGVPFVDSGGRFGMQSIAVDPLRVASFMVFPTMLMAGLQQRARTRGERLSATALFWLGVGACVLSFSRSAILQLLPALLVMWLLTRCHFRKIALITVSLGMVLLLITFVDPSNPAVKAYGLQRWAIAGRLASEHYEPREIIWDASMRGFRTSPVIGIGLNNFLARYFEFRDPWLTRGWIYWNQKAVHSTYMGALTETGLLGLGCCVAMMLYFLGLGVKVVRRARAEGDPARYLLGAAVLAGFCGQIVAGIALELLSHNHVWVLMAFLAALDRRPAAETAVAEAPAAPSPPVATSDQALLA